MINEISFADKQKLIIYHTSLSNTTKSTFDDSTVMVLSFCQVDLSARVPSLRSYLLVSHFLYSLSARSQLGDGMNPFKKKRTRTRKFVV